MKLEKMSLKNVQDKLSRKEMKSIMAGSGGFDGGTKYCMCMIDANCYYYNCNGGGFYTCVNGVCQHRG